MNTKMLFPKDLKELTAALSQMTGDSKILSGGTDLIIALHEGRMEPDLLIDVSDIGDMLNTRHEDNAFKIGASVSFNSLENNPMVLKYFPALAQAASGIGSKQIRNRGTIGGNIANASPAGDMLPPLIALGARASVLDNRGNINIRTIEDILLQKNGAGLVYNEVIVSIDVTIPKPERHNCFAKLGTRKAVSIARLNIAMDVTFSNDDKVFYEPVVVMGALGETPVYAKHSEKAIKDQRISADTICAFANALSQDVCEAIPNRYSLPYKKEAVKGLAEDILRNFAD